MKQQEGVCTTADIWSSLNKSYIGVTAHWISAHMKRQCVALACKRITGSHTYDVIAELQFTVWARSPKDMFYHYSQWQQHDKALLEFQEPSEAVEYDIDDSEIQSDSKVQEYVTVTNVSEILCGSHSSDSTGDNGLVFLPKHARCASHSLNLVPVHDIKQIIANIAGVEKFLLRCLMAKCTALWNNVARSTKSADAVESIIHVFAHTWSYSMECYF